MNYLFETVTEALAALVESCTLTAVTVTVDGEGTDVGALYEPFVMVPTSTLPPVIPFTFHVTAVFVALLTVAVNKSVVLMRTLAEVGEIFTLTGGGVDVIVAVAEPIFEVSAVLVACIVTDPGEGIDVGAV